MFVVIELEKIYCADYIYNCSVVFSSNKYKECKKWIEKNSKKDYDYMGGDYYYSYEYFIDKIK